MSDDLVAGIVFGSIAALIAVLLIGGFAVYWRQRLRFTRGDDPVILCSLRWWHGPLGLGWRQALVRLGNDELAYRRRLTFRANAQLVLARSELTFVDRARAGAGDWMWVGDADVITVATADRRFQFAFLADDGDVFCAWLGTDKTRPARPADRRMTFAVIAASIVFVVIALAFSDPKPWLLLSLPIGVAAWTLTSSLYANRIRVSRALGDEFVQATAETFGFLQDFGFNDSYIQHFPWQTTIVFTGTDDRAVTVRIDRRKEVLDLSFGRHAEGQTRRLRDVLEEEQHPDPDRITRFAGDDGPILKALEANSHALRLWARPFLTSGAAGAPAPRA